MIKQKNLHSLPCVCSSGFILKLSPNAAGPESGATVSDLDVKYSS
mgnify:CR=1 FL=1